MYIIYIHILYVPYLYHICTISPVSNGYFAILVDAIQRRYPTVPSLRAVGSQPVPFSDFSCRVQLILVWSHKGQELAQLKAHIDP